MPNPMIFVDLPSPDPEAHSRFYADLFGWEYKRRPAGEFHEVLPGIKPNLGIHREAEPARGPMPRVYVMVDDPPLPNGSIVAVGTFDGVHRGHAYVLSEVRGLADELECPAVAVTFDRHPASVVRPESAPRLLTDLRRKAELIADHGIDYLYVL